MDQSNQLGQSDGPTNRIAQISWNKSKECEQSVVDLRVLDGGREIGRGNRHEVVLGPGEAVRAQHNLLRRKELTKTIPPP